jgi:hypothetical protein
MRENSRHHHRLKVVMDDGESYTVGWTRELSASGLYFESPEPVAEGTPIRLQLFADALRTALDLRARVVRCETIDPDSIVATDRDGSYGLGVEFVDLGTDSQESVSAMIRELEARPPRTIKDPYLDFILS